jgi:hypothetical protein
MITFHNDNLVSPVLCDLLYNTVDERLHRPVIFIPCSSDSGAIGVCHFRYIDIYLKEIFMVNGDWKIGLWQDLLYFAYHEFGHIATIRFARHVQRQAYENKERGYWFAEQLAIDWANEAVLKLFDKDERLFLPSSLGTYFDGLIRLATKPSKNASRRMSIYMFFQQEYRKFISGGQLSSGEVASLIGALKYPKTPFDSSKRVPSVNSDLICRLADDLAYFYTDSVGRRYRFFAYGDVPEIAMRLARYETTHKPTGSFLEYQAQQGISPVPESNYPFA